MASEQNNLEDIRIKLHYDLVTILGSNNVYYQPPESIKINYPAIVYERDNLLENYADNIKFIKNYKFKVTVIDEDPDSEIVNKMYEFKNSKFLRHFANEGLNHDVFTICY